MIRVAAEQTKDFQFGLIWIWQTFLGRRLVGHSGVLPGITNYMWANEKRTLGVIVLSNGDITVEGEQAVTIHNVHVRLMIDLLECFE